MADETNSNLTPEQMAARIAELEGRLAKGSRLSLSKPKKKNPHAVALGNCSIRGRGLQTGDHEKPNPVKAMSIAKIRQAPTGKKLGKEHEPRS